MKAAPSIETENENNHDEFFFGCDDNDIEGLDQRTPFLAKDSSGGTMTKNSSNKLPEVGSGNSKSRRQRFLDARNRSLKSA